MMVGSPPASAAVAASSSLPSSSSSLTVDTAAGNASFSNSTDALQTITEGDQTEDGTETAAAAALPPTLSQQLAAAHSTGVAPTDALARSISILIAALCPIIMHSPSRTRNYIHFHHVSNGENHLYHPPYFRRLIV